MELDFITIIIKFLQEGVFSGVDFGASHQDPQKLVNRLFLSVKFSLAISQLLLIIIVC